MEGQFKGMNDIGRILERLDRLEKKIDSLLPKQVNISMIGEQKEGYNSFIKEIKSAFKSESQLRKEHESAKLEFFSDL